jgi:hypothetical protein
METFSILNLWLAEVPIYTDIFVKLALVVTILNSVANPLMIANAATGKVKLYQSLIGGLMILILPLSYLALEFGASPWSVYVVHIIICIIAFIVRIALVIPSIRMTVKEYICQMVIPCLKVMILAIPIPLLFHMLIQSNYLRLIVVALVCVICSSIASYIIGLSVSEKRFVREQSSSFIKKVRPNKEFNNNEGKK